MVVTGFSKICFLSLCLSLIVLGTSASISKTRVELFKKFFTAAQDLNTAVVAAGGIEKLKQDPKYKGISAKIIDVVYGAGKALEDLLNPDVSVRRIKSFWPRPQGFIKSGKKALQGVQNLCDHVA